MSFQKKNVSVPKRPAVTPPVGGLAPDRRPLNTAVPLRGPVPNRGIPSSSATPSKTSDKFTDVVRPSILSSATSTISTGCFDLDKLFGHNGVPLGSTTLLEEGSTTDYASILLRMFAAQGCIHSSKYNNTVVAVVGANAAWGRQLPGESEKRRSSSAETSKPNATMKIAWRYGYNNEVERKGQLADNVVENYTSTFDLTKRLSGPAISKVEYIPADKSIIAHIEKLLADHPDKIVRVCIPTFLHPAIYAKTMSDSDFVIGFFTQLRALTRKYKDRFSAMVSLPLVLYPRSSPMTRWMELLSDSVLEFHPFSVKVQEKQFQGLVNVLKLAGLSERGHMLVTQSEYAFRVTKRTFEIDEWSIPVEEEEEKKEDILAF